MIYAITLLLVLVLIYQGCKIEDLRNKVDALDNDITATEECVFDLKNIFEAANKLIQSKDEHKDD